jgi:hypothetical protein
MIEKCGEDGYSLDNIWHPYERIHSLPQNKLTILKGLSELGMGLTN